MTLSYVASPPEQPAQFTPLDTASPRRRLLVFVVGPLLWLVALIVVGLVVAHSRVVEIGLVATLVAFVIGLGLSATARYRRLREEREAE
jgi:hypothetical protein